jgi:hypothetical protein
MTDDELSYPAPAVITHQYVSTACMHSRHDRCRERCKFCGMHCRCACHIDVPS